MLSKSFVVFVTAVMGLFLLAVGGTSPVETQDASSPDLACRGCHGDNQRTLTLPSGQEIPLLVDLTALDDSPHGAHADPAMSCTVCHVNETRYRYPHAANPAEDIRDFRAAVSETCRGCHYPHIPFHDEEVLGDQAPTCADCHGSHNISRVDEMGDTMPAFCIACHTDENAAWAASFVAPRPGLGTGAEGYAGSTRCAGCHEDLYFRWRDTLHARLIQNPEADPSLVLGDFEVDDPNRPFALDDVIFTIGSRWKQQYLTPAEEGGFHILPAQWNVASGEWVPYHLEDWPERDWLQSCGSCHVTGLDTERWEFTEFNVGCEACHGPAAAHSADPENVKPVRSPDDQACGACHSRGTSPDGYEFPATYRPGDTLTDHFAFTTNPDALWPNGSARWNHQQYTDWTLGNTMEQADGMACITCHVVHDDGSAAGQLREPLNELCLECHNEQRALIRHIPFHEQAISKRSFSCADCHMPLLATSATPFDLHSHTLLQPDPEGSVVHGGIDMMPNACNRCHTKPGESPEWAAQTIAHARALATPSAGSYFGPGPTPTSPPPPTPISVVGQSAVEFEVQTGRWLRIGLYALAGFALIAGVVVLVMYVRSRRVRNA